MGLFKSFAYGSSIIYNVYKVMRFPCNYVRFMTFLNKKAILSYNFSNYCLSLFLCNNKTNSLSDFAATAVEAPLGSSIGESSTISAPTI